MNCKSSSAALRLSRKIFKYWNSISFQWTVNAPTGNSTIKKPVHLRLSGIFNATENFRICRLKIKTLSSFTLLISYLLACLQLLVFKLNRDYDVFSRNSCLGYPCILPHVLLDVSTFSVEAKDFSGPCLNRSGNSFNLRCLAEQAGAAVSLPPFIITQCCPPSVPFSLAPGCSSPSPPVVEPFSVADWVCQSGQQGHIPQCQCWHEGRKTVCTTEEKGSRTRAAKRLLILLQRQGSSLILFILCSLDTHASAANTLLQWPGWALEQNPSLRFAFGNQPFSPPV